MKVYDCVVCGKRIPAKRAAAALLSKQKPKYDSDRCARTGQMQRWRKRQATKKGKTT